MTTSGVYSFSVNRDQVIRLAMLTIGKLEQSEVPTAQEVSDCSLFLNMLVKQWQGKSDFAPGLKTWTRKHGHLFLQGTTGTYTIGPGASGWTNSYVDSTLTANAAASQPTIVVASSSGMNLLDNIGVVCNSGTTVFWTTILNIVGNTITLNANLPYAALSTNSVYVYTTVAQQPLVIETCSLRDAQDNDTPMRSLTLAEYDAIPGKQNTTNQSDPTSFYYEFLLTNSLLYLDVAGAQDLTKHMYISYMEAVQDFTNPNDTPYYPQEWYLALSLGLAKLISPMFNAPWNALMEENYKSALAIAQKKQPEVINVYFQCGDEI